MASLRNQHFVPRVHLAPFTTNEDRKSISLYSIGADRQINDASSKHQCSGAYFYGIDPTFEKLLGEIEGRYANVVREIRGGEISDDAEVWLRMFMALQEYRTRKAVETYRELMERSAAITFRGKGVKEAEEIDFSPLAMTMGCLTQFKAQYPYLKDLRLCVLANHTKHSFITSDDPLVHANRFYAQRIKSDNYGVANAGRIIMLPLTPRLVACLFDDGVYKVPVEGSFVRIGKTADVLALNEFQHLWADKHIYYSNPAEGGLVRAGFLAAAYRRPKSNTRFFELGEYKPNRFGPIKNPADEERMISKVTMFQTPKPEVLRWPSVFGWKLKPRAFTNGSAAGYVRDPKWLTAEGREKA